MSKTPTVSLNVTGHQMLGDGTIEVTCTCRAEDSETEKLSPVLVEILHVVQAATQEILFTGVLNPGEFRVVKTVVDPSHGMADRIFVREKGNSLNVDMAALHPDPTMKAVSSGPSFFGPSSSDLLKSGDAFVNTPVLSGQPRTTTSTRSGTSAPFRSPRPQVKGAPRLIRPLPPGVGTKVRIRDVRSRVDKTPAPQPIPSRRTGERKPRFSPFGSVGRQILKSIALALTVGGAGDLYVGYQEAEEVTKDAAIIPLIPVYTTVEGKRSADPISYLSSRGFIPDSLEYWNQHSRYTLRENEKSQADHVQMLLHPVAIEDVKPGGRLDLTRKALVDREDGNAEWDQGIDFMIPYRLLTHGGGGSTIHDQLCGALWDQTGKFDSADNLRKPLYGLAPLPNPLRFERKINEVGCAAGLGLGKQMPLDQVFASYMTFVNFYSQIGLMNFMSVYWDIKDLSDPRFDKGKQIVLATLPSRHIPRYKDKLKIENFSPSEKADAYSENWDENITPVAVNILKHLRAKGIVSSAQEESDILTQINAAKPNFHKLSGTYKKEKVSSPFAYVNVLATKELRDSLKVSGQDSEVWRASIDGVTVSVLPELQKILPDEVRRALVSLPSEARALSFVANDSGEIIAIFTGGKDGFDGQSGVEADRRLTDYIRTGSIGKLIVSSAITRSKHSIDDKNDPLIQAAIGHVRWSDSKLVKDANAMDVPIQPIRDMVNCYGSFNDNNGDALVAAVEGGWVSSPAHVAGLFHALMKGETPFTTPHLVTGEIRHGEVSPYVISTTVETPDCARLVYNNGAVRPWGALPFGGTMQAIHQSQDVKFMIGKTGTANAITGSGGSGKALTTNIFWAPVGVEYTNGSRFFVVSVVEAEKIDTNGNGSAIDSSKNLGAHLLSSDVTVPLTDNILRKLSTLQK